MQLYIKHILVAWFNKSPLFKISPVEFCSGADGAFEHLCNYGKRALELINLFFCEAPLGVGAEAVINDSFFK